MKIAISKFKRPLHKYMFNAVSLLLIVSMATMPVKAYDWSGVTVHVVNISPVGFPSQVEFQGDTAPGTCPSNLFFYFPQGADQATQQTNAKGIMAILVAAQLTGHAVSLYGINPTSTFQYCQVQWIVASSQP